MILFLFLASCEVQMNQCSAGAQRLVGGNKANCGNHATVTIQVVGDDVYAVCSCPCDEPVVDDLRGPPERIEHR